MGQVVKAPLGRRNWSPGVGTDGAYIRTWHLTRIVIGYYLYLAVLSTVNETRVYYYRDGKDASNPSPQLRLLLSSKQYRNLV